MPMGKQEGREKTKRDLSSTIIENISRHPRYYENDLNLI